MLSLPDKGKSGLAGDSVLITGVMYQPFAFTDAIRGGKTLEFRPVCDHLESASVMRSTQSTGSLIAHFHGEHQQHQQQHNRQAPDVERGYGSRIE